jgi:hypothetical protein
VVVRYEEEREDERLDLEKDHLETEWRIVHMVDVDVSWVGLAALPPPQSPLPSLTLRHALKYTDIILPLSLAAVDLHSLLPPLC